MSRKRRFLPCSRSRIRAAPLVAPAVALLAATSLCGCGHRSVSLSLRGRTTRNIQVEGTIRWLEQPEAPYVNVMGVPRPSSEWVGLVGAQVRIQQGTSHSTYHLDLPIQFHATLVREERWHGVRIRTSARPYDRQIRSYAVCVEPPPGWTVTPKEIVVSTDTANADFVLTKVLSPAETAP